MSNRRFYLEPIRAKAELPFGVAMQCFVKTSGDTVGVLYINDGGGFPLWREGSCLGTFDTVNDAYRELDRRNV
jgi:hypothetical protein